MDSLKVLDPKGPIREADIVGHRDHVKAARLPVDFVKALLNHNDKGVTDTMRAGTCSKKSVKPLSQLRRRLCR